MQKAAGNAAVSRLLAGGDGAAIPQRLRQDMERRFGQDFGAVRIHDGREGARAAETISAKAFTFGPHIAFASGRFAPDTQEGRRLLGHELAHVIQQRRGGPATSRIDGKGSLEGEAARASQAAAGADGAIVVTGGSAVGVAADPAPDQPWYKRAATNLFDAASAARDAYDDPRAALDKAEAAAKEAFSKSAAKGVYDEYAGKAREMATEAKAAWDKSETKKAIEEEINQQTPNEMIADYVEKHQPAAEDSSPQAKLARSASKMMSASAKLGSEPMRAAARALLEGHPIQAVRDAQGAADQGLKDMKAATFGAVNQWEDGEFDAPTQSYVDPAAHPTLAKAESGLNAASQEVNKRRRQVVGGAFKAAYTMVEGLDHMLVHPVDTAEGLGKIAKMGNPISSLTPDMDTVGRVGDFGRDLLDPKLSTGDAFERAYEREKQKQLAKGEQSKELAKGILHNYVEAAGGEFVPPENEQSDEQKQRFKGKKPGEISWEGWSKRERIGEIPGLAAVDIGSFFIGGGEANAATKAARAARIGGEVTEAARGLEALSEAGKLREALPGAGKSVGEAGELLKPAEVKPVPPEPLPVAEPKPAEALGPEPKVDLPEPGASKSTPPIVEPREPMALSEAKPVDAPKVEPAPADLEPGEAASKPVEPTALRPAKTAKSSVPDIASAKGRRYPAATQKALDEARVGADAVTPLREGSSGKAAAPPPPAEAPPENLYDISSGKKIEPTERPNPNEVQSHAVPEEVAETVPEVAAQQEKLAVGQTHGPGVDGSGARGAATGEFYDCIQGPAAFGKGASQLCSKHKEGASWRGA